MNPAPFLQHLQASDKAPRTLDAYARDLQAFSAWFTQTNGEPPAPAAVTPLDIREYRQYLQTVKRLKPASVNRRLAGLRAYFRWAREKGLVASSPLEGIRDARQTPRPPRWLNRQETYALLRAAEEAIRLAEAKGQTVTAREARRNAAIVALMLHAGLRVSEVCGLAMGDVQVGERAGRVVVRAGKGGKYREVPLNRDARRALRGWLAAREGESERLFVGRRGLPLRARGVQRVLKRLAKGAGLAEEKVTPHALRHTFGKNLVDAGVSLERVAALMGHANLNTTARYTTPSTADLAAAVERIAWAD